MKTTGQTDFDINHENVLPPNVTRMPIPGDNLETTESFQILQDVAEKLVDVVTVDCIKRIK